MTCTRCNTTGFLNTDHLTDEHAELLDELGAAEFLTEFLQEHQELYYPDVTVCDCCGNGSDSWHDVPGEHYNSDIRGMDGPYAYNGGLCECN